MTMTTNTRDLVLGAGAAALFSFFLLEGRTGPASVVHTASSSETHAKRERTVVRTQTKTVLPDGTKTVVTKTEAEERAGRQEKTQAAAMSAPARPPQTKYRISVDYLPSLSRAPRPTDLLLRAGARLGSSPFWAETGVDLRHGQLTVGVSFEW